MPSESKISLTDIIVALSETEREGLQTDRSADGLSGLSGARTVGLLQRLSRLFTNEPEACYLEIGVFQGLTLTSTSLEAPAMPCYGIDNFATLDPDGTNLNIVKDRLYRFGAANAQLINLDFEQALENLGDHIGEHRVAVYFVDGPHDYRSQLICLTLIQPWLHENAVIVVDDANYPDVRWSTRDFLHAFPDYRLLFDAYTADHPANLSDAAKAEVEAGWLNGIHVLVRDREGALAPMLPPTESFERDLYLNEWLVHRLRLAELAPESLALADATVRRDSKAETAARDRLMAAYTVNQDLFRDRHEDRNLYSAGLPATRFNPSAG